MKRTILTLLVFSLTDILKAEIFFVVPFPADLVAIVTNNFAILQVDVERCTSGCDVWWSSSLLNAGSVDTPDSDVDVRVLCSAGHRQVAGVCL